MKITIRDITEAKRTDEGGAAATNGITRIEDQGRKRTVMVIDGIRQPLAHLAELIRKNGYRVLHVGRGKDALERLNTDEVALLVSGANLVDMAGSLFYLQVMSLSPDTVKFMIAPTSDLLSAAHIIHSGYVTRYLTGTWNDEKTLDAVKDGIRQYELHKESKACLTIIMSRTQRLRALADELHKSGAETEKKAY
ncbi:MAG: hypothetical protein HY884_07325 [Deltaproteobacteria bacterium]|nr:hypothetical protein [Deltaproteobacteria bacterium]